MDKAAVALGIDPADIRRRNLITKFPHTSPTGLVYDEGSYRETLEVALAAADVPAFRTRQAALRGEGRYLGLGSPPSASAPVTAPPRLQLVAWR